jgi:hypothetical protein
MGVFDGTKIMRDSVAVVRENPSLLWFPVLSTVCLALLAGFWVLWGTSIYQTRGHSTIFLALLVVAGLYSLSLLGVFFSVALSAAAAGAVGEGDASVGHGIDVAFDRLGGIAGWAAVSVLVGIGIGFVKSVKGLRLVGDAAQVAWSFATIFVVPLIALDDENASSATRRSFELSRQNWQAESGGLVALRAALLVPGVILALDWELLSKGHVHSAAGKAFLVLVLVCGIAVSVAAGVVRQVFAVTLCHDATGLSLDVAA